MTKYEIIKSIVDVARGASSDVQAYTDVEMLLKGGNVEVRSRGVDPFVSFNRSIEYIPQDQLHSFASNIAKDVMDKMQQNIASGVSYRKAVLG